MRKSDAEFRASLDAARRRRQQEDYRRSKIRRGGVAPGPTWLRFYDVDEPAPCGTTMYEYVRLRHGRSRPYGGIWVGDDEDLPYWDPLGSSGEA